jgi:hypothetical protein
VCRGLRDDDRGSEEGLRLIVRSRWIWNGIAAGIRCPALKLREFRYRQSAIPRLVWSDAPCAGTRPDRQARGRPRRLCQRSATGRRWPGHGDRYHAERYQHGRQYERNERGGISKQQNPAPTESDRGAPRVDRKDSPTNRELIWEPWDMPGSAVPTCAQASGGWSATKNPCATAGCSTMAGHRDPAASRWHTSAKTRVAQRSAPAKKPAFTRASQGLADPAVRSVVLDHDVRELCRIALGLARQLRRRLARDLPVNHRRTRFRFGDHGRLA